MAKTSVNHLEEIKARAEEELIPLRREAKDRAELLQLYKTFIRSENAAIRSLHESGAGGMEVARRRSDLIDVVLNDLFEAVFDATDTPKSDRKHTHPITLIANGGYGRGYLNPGSDIDLLFLHASATRSIAPEAETMIEQILLILFDVGFKVGHAVRSVKETIKFANEDHQTKTALLDARFITGNRDLYEDFDSRFWKQCITGREDKYLAERSEDIRNRHSKYSNTVFLQEPQVKESCGGLRDYHNLMWTIYVRRRERTLDGLVDEKILTRTARKQIEAAYEFLMRARNDLHYAQKRPSDILTLRLQGIVATNLGYPQRSILRRIEEFMRDYYRHTRNLYARSISLMQRFELEVEEGKNTRSGLLGFLSRDVDKVERFDGFHSKGGLIYADNSQIFVEDPSRMMRLFLHTQRRSLDLSPAIRNLIKKNRDLITKGFRYSRKNRRAFEQILQQRGDVARILRQMHHVGFLGRYLPEFEPLTDLVQHEFFHRYTADEHTLRCIEQLDALATTDDPKAQFFQKLFRDLEDPYILYLALILHDTGRAKNQRTHADASTMLASKVAKRLQIHGERLRRLIFLVDHHLTFWRTATSMNIDDPSTIADFAAATRNRSYMETLLLFTYVDSKGTSEEGWNDWKSSLMLRLFRSTSAYFEDQEAFQARLTRSSDDLRKEVREKLPEDYGEEIDAHFRGMPERYFRFRGVPSIVRHLKMYRRFYERAIESEEPNLDPIINWEERPGDGFSLFEVCSWNRRQLLSRVAGALASRNINIMSADLFGREDDLVLDIFRVCTSKVTPVTSKRDKTKVEKLFTYGTDVEFGKAIESARKDHDAFIEESPSMPQRVHVANGVHPSYTVLEVQAYDRLGLLYDIFNAIAGVDCEVAHARISTQQGAAIDSIYITDEFGNKLEDPEILSALETKVAQAVGIEAEDSD